MVVRCRFNGWIRRIGKKDLWFIDRPGGHTTLTLPRSKVLLVEYEDGEITTDFYVRKITGFTVPVGTAESHHLEVI